MIEKPLNQADLTPLKIKAVKMLFSKGNLDPLLHSTQVKMKQGFLQSTSDEYLVFSSRQLGKTWLGLSLAIEFCIKNPGSRVLFYAPTKDKLRDIVNDTISPLQQWAPEGLIKRLKSQDRWIIGQSELRLCVLERAHVDRNRGINCKGLLVIEEGCFVSSEDFKYAWESVIDPQRLRYKPKVLINTTPSEDEEHYIHDILLPRLEELEAVSRYTIYDNPFLSPEDIEKIKARVTEETWKREYLAEIFRSKDTVAVPEYNDTSHSAEFEAPKYANWLTAIDFGGSLDPHSIQVCFWDYQKAKFCVYKDFLMPINTSIEEIVNKALEMEKIITGGKHFRVVDCPGQVSVELSKLKFDHMRPEKPPGSFDANLQATRVAFKNDEILIHKRCNSTRNHLKNGKLNKQRSDFRRTTHHCDNIAALMYGFKYKQTHNPFPDNHFTPRQTHHTSSKKTNLSHLGYNE